MSPSFAVAESRQPDAPPVSSSFGGAGWGSLDAALAEAHFAAKHQPAYREAVAAAGLDVSALRTDEDFERLPTTDKAFFRSNFPAGVLVEGKTLDSPLVYRSASSGTSGERCLSVAYTFALAKRFQGTVAINPGFQRFFTDNPSSLACRYAAPNCSDVECATPLSTIADRTLSDGTLVLPVKHDLLATSDAMVDQALDELGSFAPRWLYIDPTHLAFLVRAAGRRGRSLPSVDLVALTYTYPTGVARRQIRAVYPAAVTANIVSMSEFGWLVMECEHGGLHCNTRDFFVELRRGDRRVQPGEVGELLVTTIGDRLSPHLRYRTGDYYSTDETPCPCGAGHGLRYEGRLRDMCVTDGRIAMTMGRLDALVGEHPCVDLYQLHQTHERRYRFRYLPSANRDPEQERALGESIYEALGPGIDLRFSAVDYIATDRSGKFSSCRSDPGNAGPEAAHAALLR